MRIPDSEKSSASGNTLFIEIGTGVNDEPHVIPEIAIDYERE
jgi:hypothetical protein